MARCSIALFLFFFALSLGCAPAPAQERPAEKYPEKQAAADEAPIPKLPLEKLPKATGVKPDPAKEQYIREAVFVKIAETIHPDKSQPDKGEPYTPKQPIVTIYLSEYFRRAGFQVVAEPAKAAYRVEGDFAGFYDKTLMFRGQAIAVKYKGSCRLQVLEAAGNELERVEIPEIYTEGIIGQEKVRVILPEGGFEDGDGLPAQGEAKPEEAVGKETAEKKGEREEKNAVLDLRRQMAKSLWDNLFQRGKPFADPEIPLLLSSLSADDAASENPTSSEEVVKKLVACRFKAVPYLLDALTDMRPVLVAASYPGLTPGDAQKLRIYHIADKALEEIFQKVSRMSLDTPARHRFIIIRGWENEWRRFCKPYRESPYGQPTPAGPNQEPPKEPAKEASQDPGKAPK
ncbi:MAG: hypothetical protein HY717_00845 [Planctomycetes bacterium]|nr:hypothetical protein [Planctomycetota bacterium]